MEILDQTVMLHGGDSPADEQWRLRLTPALTATAKPAVVFPLDMSVGEFKARVSRWANLQHPLYRTLLWTIGSHIDFAGQMGPPGTWILTIDQIRVEMTDWARQQGDDRPVPGYSTLKRYFADLRDAGVIRSEQTWYSDRGRMRRGGSRYQPNFDLVLDEQRRVVGHDFLAPITKRSRIGSSSAPSKAAPTTGLGAPRSGLGAGPVESRSWPTESSPEPLAELLPETLTEPPLSPISSTYKTSQEVQEVQEHASGPRGGAASVESDDNPTETWAVWTDIPDLNERIFERMLNGLHPPLDHVAPEYAVDAFLEQRGRHVYEANSPAGYLWSTFPQWWTEHHQMVRDGFDEDYPSPEMVLAAEEERLQAVANTARESAAAAAERRELLRLQQWAKERAQQVEELDYLFNAGYGDIYDFEQLLEDGYSPLDITADLEARRSDARDSHREGSDPRQWREDSGGEQGLRQRLPATTVPTSGMVQLEPR